MATYRERRLAKAERLDAWAESRRQKSAAAAKAYDDLVDRMPFGQPILVGHHSERATRRHYERVQALDDQRFGHAGKAYDFETRAAGIRGQAARSIYNDDPDAVEHLREKIAGLEARHARMLAINAAIKPRGRRISATTYDRDALLAMVEREFGQPLTDTEKDDLDMAARFNQTIGYPTYAISNSNGNITRHRKRLARLVEATP